MEKQSEQKAEQSGGQAILWTLITLSLPTVAEEVLATLLQYVDTAMVGRLGEAATAAVSVTTTITWLVNSVAGAVGIGVLTLIAQAVGRKDKEMIRRISAQVLLMTIGCALVTGGLSIVLSPFIPVWMGAERAVQGPASTYFLIVSLPMLFRNATTILGAAIRATKDTKTPMLINMISNLCNVVLNYILIYQAQMGVSGAATASAVSYTLGGTLMFIAYRKNKTLCGEETIKSTENTTKKKMTYILLNQVPERRGSKICVPIVTFYRNVPQSVCRC